jgi:ribosomal protein S18 acetylase RimI-like enzyme
MKKIPLVRPCRSFDVGEVERLARRPRAARWSREAYAAEAERTDSLFLVADDGRVLGYAVARLFEGEAQLLDVAVAEDGQGVGRALWAALTAAAKARGASKLTLEVSAANSRALLFYKRAGAVVVGRRPKFYNDGSDAVLMDAPLT